jgi:Periplasmic glucan biosynthesis protein, MdoG
MQRLKFPSILLISLAVVTFSSLQADTSTHALASAPLSVARRQEGFANREKMDIDRLKEEAFSRCQHAYQKPNPARVKLLDPPEGDTGEGMTYPEELDVKTRNVLDREGFYFSPRPRAAVNDIPMEIYVEGGTTGVYERKTWEDVNPDFSSKIIQPPIDKNQIPPSARVLTELIIGHQAPTGGFPQLFDFRSSGYVRFSGYPPSVTGASMRVAAHNIFGLGDKKNPTLDEDFPIIRIVFASVKNNKTANLLLLVESDLFCGALSVDLSQGAKSEMVVDGYWYTRKDFDWKKEPNTALIAYSSMFWRGSKDTPDQHGDQAHDSDTLVATYSNHHEKELPIEVPSQKDQIYVRDPGEGDNDPLEWTLEQKDRNPDDYAVFKSALTSTNYDLRPSYRVEVLKSNVTTGVRLYESAPVGEFKDNIVAALVLRQDIKKAKSSGQFIQLKYRTSAQ